MKALMTGVSAGIICLGAIVTYFTVSTGPEGGVIFWVGVVTILCSIFTLIGFESVIVLLRNRHRDFVNTFVTQERVDEVAHKYFEEVLDAHRIGNIGLAAEHLREAMELAELARENDFEVSNQITGPGVSFSI